MKFEHLIEINDPLNPLIDELSRATLWRGLERYVFQPQDFQPAVDACHILSQHEGVLERELHYGHLRVRDRVTLDPLARVHYHSQGSDAIPEGTLTLTIEAPDETRLFLRFQYETFPRGDQIAPPEYQQVLKDAWRASGIDIVKRIRDLAAEGALA